MKKNFTTIILIALVIISILDGDFADPSVLDFIKFGIIALGLVLTLIVNRKDEK